MSIVTTTDGQKLQPKLKADPNQPSIWETHPVRLSDIEKQTFNLNCIASILTGESQSPSELAEIQPEHIASPLLRRVDQVYHNAIRSYKDKLDLSCDKDLKSIQSNRHFRIYEKCRGFAWLMKIFGASFISRDQYQRDARAYRYAWFIEVSALEQERLSSIKSQIEAELAPLIEDLEELEEDNQTDIDLLEQAIQLKDVYNAHFPNIPLAKTEVLERMTPVGRDS